MIMITIHQAYPIDNHKTKQDTLNIFLTPDKNVLSGNIHRINIGHDESE